MPFLNGGAQFLARSLLLQLSICQEAITSFAHTLNDRVKGMRDEFDEIFRDHPELGNIRSLVSFRCERLC